MPTGTVVFDLACRRLSGIRADLELCALRVHLVAVARFWLVSNTFIDVSPFKFIAAITGIAFRSFSVSMNFSGLFRLLLGVERLLALHPLHHVSLASLEDHLSGL